MGATRTGAALDGCILSQTCRRFIRANEDYSLESRRKFTVDQLTRTFKVLLVEIGQALGLQLARRQTLGVWGEAKGRPQIPRQPRQMTIARKGIVGQAQRPQPQPDEQVPGQGG